VPAAVLLLGTVAMAQDSSSSGTNGGAAQGKSAGPGTHPKNLRRHPKTKSPDFLGAFSKLSYL
jgi:hypothetical protein